MVAAFSPMSPAVMGSGERLPGLLGRKILGWGVFVRRGLTTFRKSNNMVRGIFYLLSGYSCSPVPFFGLRGKLCIPVATFGEPGLSWLAPSLRVVGSDPIFVASISGSLLDSSM